jgi:DTW domain-containing protein YfiP
MDAPERAMRSRRLPRCPGCRAALSLCICSELVPTATRTQLVVVAHRNEVHKSTNTARLAVQMVLGAELHVRGEQDVPPPVLAPTRRRLVLFPSAEARVLTPTDEPCVLLVPDGSWPQARKVMRREPLAEGAEPVRLEAPPTRYTLRRGVRDGGLCTMEAIARALGILEGPERGPVLEARMLAVLERWIERQTALRTGRVHA